MSKHIAIDFETYFSSKEKYSLTKMGPVGYIRDPRFLVQLLGVCIDGEVHVYEYSEIPKALKALDLENSEVITIGHNINGFDALILSEYYGIRPATIYDTMVMMRWAGLSRCLSESHKILTMYLENGIKEEGTKTSDGKRTKSDFTKEEWEFFVEYCANDAKQCYANYCDLFPFVTQDALDFCSLTAKMATEPCIEADIDRINRFLETLEAKTQENMLRLSQKFTFNGTESFLKALRSTKVFVGMLKELGVDPTYKVSIAKTKANMEKKWSNGEVATMKNSSIFEPALSKEDAEFVALAEHENPDVAALVTARLEMNSIPRSRAENILKIYQEGKALPVQLAAFKAHTGRYAAGNSEGKGDGLNWQNFPKKDKDMLELRKSLLAPKGYVFVSSDSSQIEARMLAWVANEKKLVASFREGRDPYSELASKIFHVSAKDIIGGKDTNPEMKRYRNVGKTAILSAGYGIGKEAFADRLWLQGAYLGKTREEHNKKAVNALATYRKENDHIVKLWAALDEAIKRLKNGGNFKIRCFSFKSLPMVGAATPIPSVILPSGYTLRYPGLRHVRDKYNKKWHYVFDTWHNNGLKTDTLYGGKLTENLIQALAFQLLMWQALEMEKAGLHIKCNIHDSFLVCVPESQAEETKAIMESCMSRVPDWLEGFPVACEAAIGKDFTIA